MKAERKVRYDYCRNDYRFLVDGKVVEFNDIQTYCKERGMDRDTLFDTYRKNKKPYMGHVSLKSPELTQIQLNWKPYYHYLLSVNGEVLKIENLREFCRTNKINRGNLKTYSRKGKFCSGFYLITSIRSGEITEQEISVKIEKSKKILTV